MPTRAGILKHYALYVTFTDRSTAFTEYVPNDKGFEQLGDAINSYFESELSDVLAIVIKKVYSEPGETVKGEIITFDDVIQGPITYKRD